MSGKANTAWRKALALSILGSGPWPTRLAWRLVGCEREGILARINARRTLRSLCNAGLVDVYADGSGEECYRRVTVLTVIGSTMIRGVKPS